MDPIYDAVARLSGVTRSCSTQTILITLWHLPFVNDATGVPGLKDWAYALPSELSTGYVPVGLYIRRCLDTVFNNLSTLGQTLVCPTGSPFVEMERLLLNAAPLILSMAATRYPTVYLETDGSWAVRVVA